MSRGKLDDVLKVSGIVKSCVERSRWLRRFDLAKIQKQRGVAIELRENIRRLLRVDSYKLLPARMEKLRKARNSR